jgi:hypothetical protein
MQDACCSGFHGRVGTVTRPEGWVKPQWLIESEKRPTWEKIASRLIDAGLDEEDARALVLRAMAAAWNEGAEAMRQESRDPDGPGWPLNPYRETPA